MRNNYEVITVSDVILSGKKLRTLYEEISVVSSFFLLCHHLRSVAGEAR